MKNTTLSILQLNTVTLIKQLKNTQETSPILTDGLRMIIFAGNSFANKKIIIKLSWIFIKHYDKINYIQSVTGKCSQVHYRFILFKVKIYHNQNILITHCSQKRQPYILPSRSSYALFIVRILDKIDRVIKKNQI